MEKSMRNKVKRESCAFCTKNSKTVYFDKKYLIKTANCKQYAEMI